MSLQVKAMLAGLFFGIWPLLMNRSNLSGNLSSAIFTAIVLICVLPFSLGSTINVTNINWGMALPAGILGALGIMSFNGMLAKATPANVSTLFVLMILVQTVIPATYHIAINGGLNLTKGLGFVFAAIAAILLLK